MKTADQRQGPVQAADDALRRVATPERVAKLRSLPVGWAALLITFLGIVVAVAMTLAGALPYGAAGFFAALIMVGTLLGLAAWDFLVGLLALRNAPHLALPERITLDIPPRAVPYLSPIAFGIGILIGHQYWH